MMETREEALATTAASHIMLPVIGILRNAVTLVVQKPWKLI